MELTRTYRIESERLIIRCYEPSDALELREAIIESLDHLRPWLPWAKHEPGDLESIINRLRSFRGQFDLGKDYLFGIFDKTGKELIGSTGLHTRVGEGAREIGYWIRVKYINRGFAKEAVSALTKAGFEIEKLGAIEIHCSPENTRSINIPSKLGYIFERTLIKRDKEENEDTREIMIWTMRKNDYEKSVVKKINVKAFDIIGRQIRF